MSNTYSERHAFELFRYDMIEDAEFLGFQDYLRAAKFIWEQGMTHERALQYLRSWATDYALMAEIESQDAEDFERRSY